MRSCAHGGAGRAPKAKSLLDSPLLPPFNGRDPPLPCALVAATGLLACAGVAGTVARAADGEVLIPSAGQQAVCQLPLADADLVQADPAGGPT